jgi:WD40 repeat protein
MLVLKGRKVGLSSIAFSPGGARLAAGGYRGVVQVWDQHASTLERKMSTGAWNNDTVFFLDEVRLSVLNLGTVKTFDIRTGDRARGPLPGNLSGIRRVALAPDGRSLCIASATTLRLHRFGAREPAWKLALPGLGRSTALAWSGDGRTLSCSLAGASVRHLDAATGATRREWNTSMAPEITAVALSPDGRAAAWCAGTKLLLRGLGPSGLDLYHELGRTHFLSVAWHPSGDFLATANGDGKIDYWDARTGERRQSFDWGVGKLQEVIFDGTGDRAACCSGTGQIVVWDVDR